MADFFIIAVLPHTVLGVPCQLRHQSKRKPHQHVTGEDHQPVLGMHRGCSVLGSQMRSAWGWKPGSCMYVPVLSLYLCRQDV